MKDIIMVELLLIIQGIFLHSWSNSQLNFWFIFYIPLTVSVGYLLSQVIYHWRGEKNGL